MTRINPRPIYVWVRSIYTNVYTRMFNVHPHPDHHRPRQQQQQKLHDKNFNSSFRKIEAKRQNVYSSLVVSVYELNMWIHVNSHCYCIWTIWYVSCIMCVLCLLVQIGIKKSYSTHQVYHLTHRLFWCIRFFAPFLLLPYNLYNGLRRPITHLNTYIFRRFFLPRVSICHEKPRKKFIRKETHYFLRWLVNNLNFFIEIFMRCV